MKVVIVGGVAGGATAAARLRRLDENAQIIIIERGEYVSYANCGLPYYVGGDIPGEEDLILQTPESFSKRFNIDVKVMHEAVSIDAEAHVLTIRRLEDGAVFKEIYDKLILSPGSEPFKPPIEGIDDQGVFVMRTVPDATRLRRYIERNKPKRALVIGAGFIGLEIMENLVAAGMQVTVAEMNDHVLPPLDFDVACDIHNYLRVKGVALRVGCSVTRIERKGEVLEAVLAGDLLETDIVVLSVGVRPESALAVNAGLLANEKGCVVVDTYMRTTNPDIYLVGDAAEVRNPVTGDAAFTPLAGPANKQGRIAADHICGINSKYRGTQGSSIVKIFDMSAACTGINEKAARQSGLKYDKVHTYSPSHATYYPGAGYMAVKILFEKPSGRVLGAQIVGFEGVDKRCDVIAAAIHTNLTVYDLTELELCYAPPFSSAKDPVNMAGFCAENVLDGRVRQYHWNEMEELYSNEKAQYVDVRTEAEYRKGCIPGFVNIPLDELRGRLRELDSEKHVYLNCQSGVRSYAAARILEQNGFSSSHLAGGYRLFNSIEKNR